MNQRTIHNLVWLPNFLIGVTALILGLIWFWHPEPWLIDRSPNEILLQTTYEKLFSFGPNKYLSSYLKVIYRFFGLWLITIGLLIITFVRVTKLGTKQARTSIHTIMIFVLILLYYLVFSFLETSPLLPSLYFFTLLLSISIYFSTLIRE
ncbi:MAG: hypothetical protein CMG06_03185 [Candidatus Marinimicrobia bacterium]|nr:hypothetical protein [Candidatus Neomarinimicrobiota bacterium]